MKTIIKTRTSVYSRFQNLTIFIGLLCSSVFFISCASIDKGMMAISDGISSADPVTGERQINFELEEEEIRRATKITTEILSQLKANGIKVDEETPYYNKVKNVFERLKIVVHRKHLPWEIHVIEKNDWNAFTIGGGKVFVFTGMFQPDIGVQTDDELAAVLSHELAHVTARHASEGQGKQALLGLADKSLRNDRFKASFTTIQEDEADRYSVIYSALAGYDPTAGIIVWKRLHNAFGSYAGELLYDHPLNDDRANSMSQYAAKAKQYYIANNINPEHDAILKNNTVFSYRDNQEIKAGEGGGFLALLETAVNTYGEAVEAQTEELKRKTKQIEQERIASQRLLFHDLRITEAQGGGYGLFGTAINATNQNIKDAKVVIEYLSHGTVVLSEDMPWEPMNAYARKDFGIKLKSISYSSVGIRPTYVHIVGDSN